MTLNGNQLGIAAATIISAGFVTAAIWYYPWHSKKRRHSQSFGNTVVNPPTALTGGRRSMRYNNVDTPVELVPSATPQDVLHTIGRWQWATQTATYGLDLQKVPSHIVYAQEMENEHNFERLQYLGRQPLTVNAIIEPNLWSWENVHLLTRELDGFNKRAHINDWCRNMSITLPTEGIDMGDAVTASKSLKVFPDSLENLSWKGHRHQLPLFFKDEFQHLTRLSLRCELSAFDFVAILHMGRRTLESVEVRTIVDHHEPKLQQRGGLGERTSYVMEALRSLTVVSKVDFHEVISLFKFRKLEEISIVNASKTTFNLNFFARFDTNDLKRIKRMDAHCFVGEGERKWLETNISGVHVGDGPLRDRDFSIEN